MPTIATRGNFGVRVSLDTTEFDKVFNEYMKFQKRTPADVVNAKLYYIARNATLTTRTTPKEKITTELEGKAREYDAPLGAILINAKLGKGQGLSGAKMARALTKFIKKRQNSVNYVRAGWKNAIRIIEDYLRQKGEINFVRRWAGQVDNATMRRRNFKNLGKAIPAKVENSPRAWGEIENDVPSDRDIGRLEQVKLEGLQKAVNMEVRSMQIYMERKLNPVHREFNRKQGF